MLGIGQGILGIGAFKQRLPRPEEALPGRDTALPLHNQHFVNGQPLQADFGGLQVLDVGLGCFWGAERKFWQLPGVVTTAVGYQGGVTPNPTYEEACSGLTGHTEVVRVVFDPAQVTLETVLRTFWENHNPTQGMRQGNDIGTQYRSAIFPEGDAQTAAAHAGIERAGADWPAPIVTTIEPASTWHPAEDYHQAYWEGEGQRNPYCMAVIPPKLAKLRKGFADRLRAE